MKLSEQLTRRLRDQGVTQADLAKKLGVEPPTVNQWLSGTNACGEPYLARIVDEVLVSLDAAQKPAVLAGLFLLRQQERCTKESQKKWTARGKELADEASRLGMRSSAPIPTAKVGGRTLSDFPGSFYPLTVVTGDKRENSESRINPGDFGAVTASPAETRWLMRLGLREDVELLTDKLFVMEDEAQLKKRFAERNLLIIGSPASNHLARRLHLSSPPAGCRKSVPIFRFNIAQELLAEIEDLLSSLRQDNSKMLVGKQAHPSTEQDMKIRMKFLFTGGIVDPSFPNFWLRAVAMRQNRDFGLISLARNPFAENDRYVAILAAGFHMFGTAHAVRMLSEPEFFECHPFGGVIRVDMQDDEFAVKFDRSSATWDTKDESNYTIESIRQGLTTLNDKPIPNLHIPTEDFEDCLRFVEEL